MTGAISPAIFRKAQENVLRKLNEAVTDAARHNTSRLIMGHYAGLNEEYLIPAQELALLGAQSNAEVVEKYGNVQSLLERILEKVSLPVSEAPSEEIEAPEPETPRTLHVTPSPPVEATVPEPDPAPPVAPLVFPEAAPTAGESSDPKAPSTFEGRLSNAILDTLGSATCLLDEDTILEGTEILKLLFTKTKAKYVHKKMLIDALRKGVDQGLWTKEVRGDEAYYNLTGREFPENGKAPQ